MHEWHEWLSSWYFLLTSPFWEGTHDTLSATAFMAQLTERRTRFTGSCWCYRQLIESLSVNFVNFKLYFYFQCSPSQSLSNWCARNTLKDAYFGICCQVLKRQVLNLCQLSIATGHRHDLLLLCLPSLLYSPLTVKVLACLQSEISYSGDMLNKFNTYTCQ